MEENTRFQVIDIAKLELDVATKIKEVVDLNTGVHYLYVTSALGGISITPMLDYMGNVVVDQNQEK